MTVQELSPWGLVRSEALALRTRLRRIQPLSIVETMVPAAALSPEAMRVVEQHIAESISSLLPEIDRFLSWLRDRPAAHMAQERFSLLRLRFNLFLDRFDVYADAVTQRSEQPIGLWLAGLDVLADDLLAAGVRGSARPPLACYLDRGRGAAIRRARTRFADGELNPLALVRLPRERMIGSGVASSLAHEVGHQGIASLDLLEPARRALAALSLSRQWIAWASEILADFWAVTCLGISATVGLLAVVTLPQPFVFRVNEDDVHPAPWVRTLLSAALGERLFPDPQWRVLVETWRRLYPVERAAPRARRALATWAAELPYVADALTELRFPSLGATLFQHMGAVMRSPARLRALFSNGLDDTIPSLAIAALGQARADGAVSAEAEARAMDEMLRRWALQRIRVPTSPQGEKHAQPAAA